MSNVSKGKPNNSSKPTRFAVRLNSGVSRMKILVVLLVVVLTTASCDYLSDTVTSRYATLAEARADHLFERGWLPDILPESAIDIRTSNNLDINTSVGEFHFTQSDGRILLSKLTSGTPADSPFTGWQDTVTGYTEDGFTGWRYQDSDTTWAFFCIPEKGKCEYYAWLTR